MKSKILLLLTLILLNSCNTNTNLYKSIRGNALGTTYSVIVETKSNESLIEDQIDSIFNQVNLSMSTYIDSSIITRVNKSAKPVKGKGGCSHQNQTSDAQSKENFDQSKTLS